MRQQRDCVVNAGHRTMVFLQFKLESYTEIYRNYFSDIFEKVLKNNFFYYIITLLKQKIIFSETTEANVR